MNYTQNQKISEISSHTLIIGVDIEKFKHVARAQDFRGVDLGKTLTFENSKEGIDGFLRDTPKKTKEGTNPLLGLYFSVSRKDELDLLNHEPDVLIVPG